ncbi:DUF2935 domain-containing protein [Cohnella candidum]|uniref:DUF2935 domain-containing protein n=1 Tax=Cohnella candidum TaxID=2674991 RepID=A0A3G3JU48_9BACL|nr:DUF2935 domain-containing protein [Cohnella candidum]AYQ71407.1 DUF2935 domain-containing protein [Cohnella candidum]
MNPLYQLSPWEEHRFWIEVLQDHAYFVFEALSPADTKPIAAAAAYIQEFGAKLEELQRLNPQLGPAEPDMIRFARSVQPLSNGYYRFEGQLQALRLQNRITLDLSPTYLNGTLSENAEYDRLLASYAAGVQPEPLPQTDLVDLWLEDQLGHASLLLNYIDVAEVGWIERIREYVQTFAALMVKQRQIKRYLRFVEPGFPVEKQFAVEIITAVNGFAELVRQVVALYLTDRVSNKFTLRFVEHHFPETCYFLRKMTLYAPEVPVAPCSLTKPHFTPLNVKNPGIREV